jgi:hypothetical protein
VKLLALTPPNFTDVAPVRFVPLITTALPPVEEIAIQLIVGGENKGLIVILKGVELTKPAELVARITMGPNVPATVGVPDKRPLEARVSPGGREPLTSEYVSGPVPLAVNV